MQQLLLAGAAVLAVLAGAEEAAASITLVTDRSDLRGDDRIDWRTIGAGYDPIQGPVKVAGANGQIAVSADNPDGRLRVYYEGSGWDGTFAPGEALLYTEDTPGPLELVFSRPVQGVGVQIQRNSFGSFTATIAAFDSAHALLGTFDVAGEARFEPRDVAPFLGVLSGLHDIKSIRLTVDGGLQDFAIDTLSLTVTPVPLALPLFGTALIGLAGLAWQHRRPALKDRAGTQSAPVAASRS